MNVRFTALAAAIVVSTTGLAFAAPTQNTTIAALSNDRGSDRNLRNVRRRLERIIDQLQRDQRDYGGHRVRAIQDLQQARLEIDAALQADAAH
ncbi:hypothetical protein [Vulcanimicrobium alpinum]|nr:hypothetical protein [Vulcanimicrobium alpinum]